MNHTPSVSVRNIVLGEGIPKICIPLVSTCLDALLNDMKKALDHSADLIEWRVDWMDDILKKRLSGRDPSCCTKKQPGILLFFLPSAPKRKAEIWLPAFYSIKNW